MSSGGRDGHGSQCVGNGAAEFFRTGVCKTGPLDSGRHVVCARASREFLEFTKSRGNDPSTPRPGFAGLAPGDRWCLCARRWKEALEAGGAPPVVLEATHASALRYVGLEALKGRRSGEG
ncbi:MAG: DUF2237 domain-containing protein [Desulfobacterales bacterium]|nr:DUF2237 domain-containing protein [Desulfobacterales bacterium]